MSPTIIALFVLMVLAGLVAIACLWPETYFSWRAAAPVHPPVRVTPRPSRTRDLLRGRLPNTYESLPVCVLRLVLLAERDGCPVRVERPGRDPKRVTLTPAVGSELELELASTCGLFRALPSGEWVWEVN